MCVNDFIDVIEIDLNRPLFTNRLAAYRIISTISYLCQFQFIFRFWQCTLPCRFLRLPFTVKLLFQNSNPTRCLPCDIVLEQNTQHIPIEKTGIHACAACLFSLTTCQVFKKLAAVNAKLQVNHVVCYKFNKRKAF